MNRPSPPRIPLLELDLLHTLAAIADTGSFSAAAREVFRTPSAISMQVRKVEEIVGRPVFLRDSRNVTPTADGELLVEHARRMLALNREMLARFIAPDLSGSVRMGAPDDVAEKFLHDMLRRFSETHPGVTVDLVVAGSGLIRQQIATGHLDLGLVDCSAGASGEESMETLYREPLVWAMLKGGVAVERDPLPISAWEEGCTWRQAAIGGLEKQQRRWRLAVQSAHISGQRAAMLADLAVAPIPQSSLGGDIVPVPERHGLPGLPDSVTGLLVSSDPSAPAQAAAEHLRASFARCCPSV